MYEEVTKARIRQQISNGIHVSESVDMAEMLARTGEKDRATKSGRNEAMEQAIKTVGLTSIWREQQVE